MVADKYSANLKDLTGRNKSNFKVLNVSECSLKTLGDLKHLKLENFSHLFMVCVHIRQPENVYAILEVLIGKFGNSQQYPQGRPLIVQFLGCSSEIFFKDFGSKTFLKLAKDDIRGLFGLTPFQPPNTKVLESITNAIKASNNSLVLRYLHLFPLEEEEARKLILECAASGNPSQLAASLDMTFNHAYECIGEKVYTALTHVSRDNQSVLRAAVIGKKAANVEFILNFAGNSLDCLPFGHKLTIVNDARKHEILLMLLQKSDFPFPAHLAKLKCLPPLPQPKRDFKQQIIELAELRDAFHAAIAEGNVARIRELAHNFEFSRIAFNTLNNSALKTSLAKKQFRVFVLLRQMGFRFAPCESGELTKLTTNERAEITAVNIEHALRVDAVLERLMTKTLLHNRDMSGEHAQKCRARIREIYAELLSFAETRDNLAMASKCVELCVVFHFGGRCVADIDPVSMGSGSDGVVYPAKRHIFIGAHDALTNEKTKRHVCGVLNHEFCHLALDMAFENVCHPFYHGDKESARAMDAIVNEMLLHLVRLEEDAGVVDDECEGIVRRVFTDYPQRLQGRELIVRPAQIIAFYGDNVAKVAALREKYASLFNHFARLRPEMEKRNARFSVYERVRKLNRIIGLLARIERTNLRMKTLKEVSFDARITIIESNVPLLSLVSCHQQLTRDDFYDSENLFLTTKCLRNREIVERMWKILEDNEKLARAHPAQPPRGGKSRREEIRLVICHTSGESALRAFLEKCAPCDKIFITDSERRGCLLKLVERETPLGTKISQMRMTHELGDLDEWSPEALLEKCVTFQTHENVKLSQLISEKSAHRVITCELLKLLCGEKEIAINTARLFDFQRDVVFKDFSTLFRRRRLIKHIAAGAYQIELEQVDLVSDVCGQRFVLIADGAGNGKSWLLAYVAEQLLRTHPTHWLTFVSLKDLLGELEDIKKDSTVIFEDFASKKILKHASPHEIAIFRELYKSGRVFFLFDAFDEIAPRCTEQAAKLIRAFEHNTGNQLWVTTRCYFRNTLQATLQTPITYSLKPLTEHECAEYVTNQWQSRQLTNASGSDAQKFLHALKIFSQTSCEYVGLPQLLKIVANVYKNQCNVAEAIHKLSPFACYRRIIEKSTETWQERCQLRMEISIRGQRGRAMNYTELHQFLAMRLAFGGDTFCDLSRDKTWRVEDIVGCGLVNVSNNKLNFLHETICEFFIVDFLVRIVKRHAWMTFNDFFGYLVEVLKMQKYNVVRSFLNDCADEISKEIQREAEEFARKFLNGQSGKAKVEMLRNVESEKCEKLKTLLLRLFSLDTRENVCEMLMIIGFVCYTRTFEMYLELVTLKPNREAFKDGLITYGVLMVFVTQSTCLENFKTLLAKMEEKLSKSSQLEILSLTDEKKRNLFHNFISLDTTEDEDSDSHYLSKKFSILVDYAKKFDGNLLTAVDSEGETILHIIVRSGNSGLLRSTLQELNELLDPRERRDFFMLKSNNGYNFLHMTASSSLRFHATLWPVLINEKFLLELITDKESEGDTFLHELILRSTDERVIQLVFETLHARLKAEFCQLFTLIGWKGRNLLQAAAASQKNFKIHAYLWDFAVLSSDKSTRKFLELINNPDEDGGNSLHLIVAFSSTSVLDMAVKCLRGLDNSQFRELLLIKSTKFDRNILQIAAANNGCIEVHRRLWEVVEIHFGREEIREIIKHKNTNGSNLLCCALHFNDLCIVIFIWDKICQFYNTCVEQNNYLKDVLPPMFFKAEEVKTWYRDKVREAGLDLKM